MPVRLVTTAAAGAALAVVSIAAPVPVHAAEGRNAAIFGGLAAGAVLGGALAGAGRAYGPPPAPIYRPYPIYEEDVYVAPPRCFIDRQPMVNSWGDFVGYRRVRVCD